MTHTRGPSPPARWPVKGIHRPSGDHPRPPLLPLVLVNCFCVFPSVARSHRLDELSSLSMSQVVTSTTHHLPSGATDGAPTRLTFHRSSGVIGRGAARAGLTKRRRRPTRNMGEIPR